MKKKLLISLISLFTFVLIVTGISYSYYIYNMNIVTADLTSGSISINASNNNSTISLTNVSPMSDSVGKLSNDYIDFTVSGVTNFNTIYYEINLVPSGENTIKDDYIKVYLTDQNDNQITDTLLLKDLQNSENNSNGKVIYTGLVEGNSSGTVNNYSQNYRLRLWVDESYSDLGQKEFSFELYLYAKNMETLYSTIKNSGNVSSYASVISSNPTFTTQDTSWNNANKKTVYYYTGAGALDKANVLFGGFCWQIVRTTDTGGIKLIYNGVAVNNQCKDDRSSTNWKGLNATKEFTKISGNFLYAESYDYDIDTETFNLVNPDNELKTWSYGNYEDFLGKYTCFDETGIGCSRIWYIGNPTLNDSTKSSTTKYSIGNIDKYQVIGSSSFNASSSSMSNVGYMFNKMYISLITEADVGSLYGTNVSYNDGKYFVYDDDINASISSAAADNNHHYTCGTVGVETPGTPDRTCVKVRYYYYDGIYIELENGETVYDAIKNMINYKFNNGDADTIINVYNSTIKDYLEIWYDNNLKKYEIFIDTNTVYCNERSIEEVNQELQFLGWNPQGGALDNPLTFKQNKDLSCNNVTDRFSKSNIKAPLRNPIGLLTDPERQLMTKNYATIEASYWLITPRFFGNANAAATVKTTSNDGTQGHNNTNDTRLVRPVITLKSSVEIVSGDGSNSNPYQVGELVDLVDIFAAPSS